MRSHPAQPGEGFDAPTTLERSGSEHREGAVTSLVLLERARAWVWVKDPPVGEGQVGHYTTQKSFSNLRESNIFFSPHCLKDSKNR